MPATQVPDAMSLNPLQLDPGATHVPIPPVTALPEQHAPAALHAPFAQHGLPVGPQGRQIGGDGPRSQAVALSLHMMPEQQGSLTPPQWTHLSVLLAFWYTHMTDGPSEQVPEPAPATGQQGWLTFPHSHAPCVQVPKLPADVWQAWPAPTHWPARQQPPALHADLLQQGWPGAPQLSQVNEPLEQRAFGAVQAPSEQQGWPGTPQLSQVNEPPEQRAFGAVQTAAPDAPTGQQGNPAAPQLPHAPPWQVPPTVAQVAPCAMQRPSTQQPPCAQAFPGQQGSPARPQAPPSTATEPPAPVAPPPPPSRVIVPVDPPPPSDPAGLLLQSDDATTTATARPTTNDDDKGTRPQVIASLSLRLSRLARHSTRVARDRLRVRPRGLSSPGRPFLPDVSASRGVQRLEKGTLRSQAFEGHQLVRHPHDDLRHPAVTPGNGVPDRFDLLLLSGGESLVQPTRGAGSGGGAELCRPERDEFQRHRQSQIES